MRIVTLLSDFGLKDEYVAEMKGTILTICPSANIVDISHDIEKFNIRMGALFLASASKYFPADTIHVAIVDPGVGSKRRGLLIESKRALYVGPDNGLLLPSALRDGIKEVYSIENRTFMRSSVSSTFHGRDVFAFTAGKIACGAVPSEVGPKISDPVPAALPEASASRGRISCEVLATDTFGNIVTTANAQDLTVAGIGVGTKVVMRAKGMLRHLNVMGTYSDVAEGRAVLLAGSHGYLEVAVNKGSAAKRFHLRSGDKLIFLNGQGCRS